MRDVIQKVIEAETEAKRILEAGQVEADRMLADARREAHEAAERVVHETRVEVGRVVAEATEAAEKEKRDRLTQATAEIEAQVNLDPAVKQQAVDAVVLCVCGLR